jgi:hypothetical protein
MTTSCANHVSSGNTAGARMVKGSSKVALVVGPDAVLSLPMCFGRVVDLTVNSAFTLSRSIQVINIDTGVTPCHNRISPDYDCFDSSSKGPTNVSFLVGCSLYMPSSHLRPLYGGPATERKSSAAYRIGYPGLGSHVQRYCTIDCT